MPIFISDDVKKLYLEKNNILLTKWKLQKEPNEQKYTHKDIEGETHGNRKHAISCHPRSHRKEGLSVE